MSTHFRGPELSRRDLLVACSVAAAGVGSEANSASSKAAEQSPAQPRGDAYEGLAATHAGLLSAFNTTGKQQQTRSYHVAADDISALKIAVGNFYITIADSGAGATTREMGSGGSLTVSASVEYPRGMYSQITFNDRPAITIADGGLEFSDYCKPLRMIPKGATFGISQFRTYSGMALYNPFRNPGDKHRLAPSGLADLTMGGTLMDDGTNGCPPQAIVSLTRESSTIIIGDSVAAGRFRATSAPDYRQGVVAAQFPPNFPFLNLALGGEAATNAITFAPGRRKLWPYCSHFVLHYGWNDLLMMASSDANRILTGVKQICATLPRRVKKLPCTFVPWTSSASGKWLSDADQVPRFPQLEPQRLSFNNALRNRRVDFIDGYLEIASAAESAPNSGFWKSDGTPNRYVDTTGVHPTIAGYNMISRAALGDMSALRYP